MYRHLFLEGPIQEGKSTLLRELLQPYMHLMGGFSSQRLTDNYGVTRAFRIGPAEGTALTAPLQNYISDISRLFSGNVPEKKNGIFRITGVLGKSLNFPQVFDEEAIEYLTENHGKKIILLDEIGGVELLNENFRKALYETLEGKLPCIGVLKQEKKAAYMSKSSGYDKSVVHYNKQLRYRIAKDYNGRILNFSRDDKEVRKEIEKFLYGIFTP